MSHEINRLNQEAENMDISELENQIENIPIQNINENISDAINSNNSFNNFSNSNMSRYNNVIQNEKNIFDSQNYSPQDFNDGSDSIWEFINNIFDWIFRIFDRFIGFVFLSIIFYIAFKTFLAYKNAGAKGALDILTNDAKNLFQNIVNILKYIWSKITGFFSFLWHKKWIFASIFIILISLVAVKSYKIAEITYVRPGLKAIDVESGEVLNPGFHLTSRLFSNFFLVNVSKYPFKITEVTADSKELQDVLLDLSITYHLDENEIIEFYRKEGPKRIDQITDDIVFPYAVEEIKNIVKEYSFKEVHAQQNEIKELAFKEIQASLKPMGIVIDDLKIINIRIDRNHVQVLGEIAMAKEKRKAQTEELERQKIETEQEKIRTEKEMEIAEREKLKKIKEAEGIAEYNRLISQQQITDAMLELKRIENERMRIEKWTGNVPGSVGGNFTIGTN